MSSHIQNRRPISWADRLGRKPSGWWLSVSILLTFFSLLPAQVTGLNGWNIFVDPGHSQTQNMGVNGYSEAEEVLRVALQLQDILLSQTDIDTVYLSRTSDQQLVSLYQRTQHANTLGAAWYHSIHSNAGAPDHNTTLLLWGQLYDGTPDPPVGGEDMSAIMIDILTRGMRIPTIGSWGDCSFYNWSDYCANSGGPYLYVNRNTNMPSELSEEGHHTNPAQNQLDMNAEYKRLLAYTFYWSILQYHNLPRPFVGICTGIIRDVETGVPINGAQVFLNGQTYTTDTYQSLFHNYTNDPNQLHNGFYFFEGLPDTTLPVIVTANYYYSDTALVSIVDTFFTFHNVELLSTVPPIVLSTTPLDGDSLFPAWYDIQVEFSRPMDITSTENAFHMTPAATGVFAWSNNNTLLTFSPDTMGFYTQYTVQIADSAQDAYGHQFDGDADSLEGGSYSFSFRTGPPDMSPPYIIAIYPPQVAQEVELKPVVTINFNEEVGPDSLIETLVVLERLSNNVPVQGMLEHYLFRGQSIVSFFPTETLQPDETYVTRILPGLMDNFGNAMTTARGFSFRTGIVDLDLTAIDPFETDITANWWAPQTSGSTTGIITDSTMRVINMDIVNHLTGSTKALQINYGWDVNSSAWLIREYLSGGAPRNVQFTADHLLQMYIFGDGSGNQFRFAVDDHVPESNPPAAHHEVSPWYTVDWIGWRLVTWDMVNDGTGTWIGDGVLDGQLRIDSIQLTYVPGAAPFGRLIFDDLRLADEFPLGTTGSGKAPLPGAFALYPNVPNPFNPTTTISYQLPEDATVHLIVYDLLGRQIRTLVQTNQTAGRKSVVWDGKDTFGRVVSVGMYVVSLQAGTWHASQKVILLK